MNDLKNDIERYLKGQLAPFEMHALEKKALSDPFLADALEGAREVNADAFEHDVHDLQMTIDKRTDQSKKIIPLWNWSLRIAAGLALVAVSTFVILNSVRDNKPVQLAENKIKSEPKPVEQKEQTPPTDSSEKSKESLAVAKPKTSQPSPVVSAVSETPKESIEQTSVASKNAVADLQVDAEEKNARGDAAPVEEIQIAETKQAEVSVPSPSKKMDAKDEDVKRARDKVESAPASSGYVKLDTDKSRSNNIRTIKGHVSSVEDGSALPGVNVLIKGTNSGTVTDEEGNYEIALTDKQEGIVFSFIGLQSTELDAGSSDQLDVQMSNDVSQLSEVVVTGYATNNDDSKDDEFKNLELASPLGGRKAYKQYLEKSLRYPEVALENKVEGKVTIEFTVETTGTLTDFKVLRGLGYGCDEEVIRLVKQGAAWAPSKYGEELLESNVKIRLRFALPKK